MNKRLINIVVIGSILMLLSFSAGFGQGDNTPDAMINLGLLEDAVVTGSIEADSGRGVPTDILYDPALPGYRNQTDWQEYGAFYAQNLGPVTADDPFFWMVEWPTAKNINYITCGGVYGNQLQPNTFWGVQIWADDQWQNLAKAANGWKSDSLVGKAEWLNDGILKWRGLEPVVTTKLRIIAYSMPDSDLVSIHFRARGGDGINIKDAEEETKAIMIQYLDFAGAEADNEMDEMINLGLLDEGVASANFVAGELDNIRGEPTDMLFDPRTGNFKNTETSWGEFGYPYNHEVGFITEDEPFYWMFEWPVPKNINYFTWGGCYDNQPQPETPWAVQYWDGEWVTVMDGVGGSFEEGLPGVDVDAQSVWQTDTPIQTTKFRFIAWAGDIEPLWSFHLRGRGGSTSNWDETDSTFKAILLQYKDLATAVEAEDNVTPVSFSLDQNYPNPFNPQTNIKFTLQRSGNVKLVVFNTQGQEIAVLVNGKKTSGIHEVTFNAESLSSGIYFYRLETDQGNFTKKMMFLK